MARDFTPATPDKLTVTTAVVTAAPFTVASWFNSDSATINQFLVTIGETGTGNNRWFLSVAGAVVGDPVQFNAKVTTDRTCSTTTGYTVGQWHHACGVEASATDRRVFIDGGSKATETTSTVPTGANRTRIGASVTNETGTAPFDGRIAEVVIWNVALSDAEVALISRPGFPQHRYRSGSVVGYWRLGVASPEPDWSGMGNHLTVSAPTIADHVGAAPTFGYDVWAPRSAAAIAATPSAGVLSMAGIAPSLGFAIWMPDEL
jgi:hypothetical protein